MVYEYVLRDHSQALGGRGPQASPGVTFEDLDEDGSPEILQQDHYYAGVYPREAGRLYMKTPGGLVAAPPNQHRYNGKELQDELGLGWIDYGARMLNPRIGRWNGVDALGEKYDFSAPYAYALNTPINAVDPDGRLVIFINGNDTGEGASGYLPHWYRYPNHSTTNSMFPNRRGTRDYWKDSRFDTKVMAEFKDYDAIYRDGSFGSNRITGSVGF